MSRLFILLSLLFASPLLASGPSLLPSSPASIKEVENDDSPRHMMRRFIEVLNRDDAEAAYPFIEFPKSYSTSMKREVVPALFEVLNKRGKIDVNSVSNSPTGTPGDAVDPTIEIVGSINIDGEKIPIELHYGTEKGTKAWRFSADFMEKIPGLAEILEHRGFENRLPTALVTHQYFGIKAWQWLGLFLGIGLSILIALLLSYLLFYFMKRITKRLQIVMPEQILTGFLTPFRLFLFLLLFGQTLPFLDTDLAFRQRIGYFQAILQTISLSIFALRLAAAGIELSRLSYERQGKHSATAMLGPIRKGINILIVMLGATFLLRDLGFDVTAIIAGLGIGGVAIALASQKTIENLFGGISIIMDQPVRVGDSGKFGAVSGTVEDIGLRSTKIRTLDRTLVSIPNAEFSDMTLENFEKRDKFRWTADLGIRMDASTDQMRLLLSDLKALLIAHPMVYKDPARVRFTSFTDSAFMVQIFAYIKASDYNEYIAVVEDLNLRVLDVIRETGTDLAYPSKTVYFERGQGPAQDKMKEVEKRIDDLKAKGGFPQPFYPAEWVDSRLDTLDFPEPR